MSPTLETSEEPFCSAKSLFQSQAVRVSSHHCFRPKEAARCTANSILRTENWIEQNVQRCFLYGKLSVVFRYSLCYFGGQSFLSEEFFLFNYIIFYRIEWKKVCHGKNCNYRVYPNVNYTRLSKNKKIQLIY